MLFIVSLLIRVALYLFIAAMMVFILMVGVFHLGQRMLSNLMLTIGLDTLLGSFSLLLLLGLGVLCRTVFRSVSVYFSKPVRVQRRMDFQLVTQHQRAKLFSAKIQQQDYFAELRRKQLLAANNDKHLKQLSLAIQYDLKRIEKYIPAQTYKQFQRQLNASVSLQDMSSLLKLQEQLLTYLG
jgi:hypothetical protein